MSEDVGKTTSKTYFTAGHSLFSFHVQYKDFVRSLYQNLLLSPGGLSFVDHFFISEYFEKEVLERGPIHSWISAGLEHGVIQTFAKRGFSGFRSQLEDQLKYGARGLPKHAERLARELDNIPMFEPIEIERNYGMAFDERLVKILNSRPEDFVSGFTGEQASDLYEFWNSDLVKLLRTEGYERAKTITKSSGTSGLRLATLIEAAREISTGAGSDVQDSVGRLLSDLRQDTGSSWKEEPVRRFFKIACDTFNVAMAQCIDAPPNSPKLDYDFVAVQGLSANEQVQPEAQTVLLEQASFPSLTVLRSGTSDLMIECRQKGEPYFDAFNQWQRKQDSESAGLLLEKLRNYTEDICNAFEAGHSSEKYSVIVATEKSKGAFLRDRVIGVGSGTLAGAVIEGAGVSGATVLGATAGLLGSAVLGEAKSIVISNRLSEFSKSRDLRLATDISISNSGAIVSGP